MVAGVGALISNLPRRLLALFETHLWSLLLSRESREEMLLGGEWLKSPRNKAWEQEGARVGSGHSAAVSGSPAPRAGLQRKHPKLTFRFIFCVLDSIFSY